MLPGLRLGSVLHPPFHTAVFFMKGSSISQHFAASRNETELGGMFVFLSFECVFSILCEEEGG